MKNFRIRSTATVSMAFREKGYDDFESAAQFIASLPYRRNLNKSDILSVFKDLGGTCSTKHALLRKLALENHQNKVKLMLGIFKMDADYAPLIKETLEKAGLLYIPEAHNYLKTENGYFDFTRNNATYTAFRDKILLEKELEYDEIVDEKVRLHKNYLQKWIAENNLTFTLDEIWQIREQCILDLQKITS